MSSRVRSMCSWVWRCGERCGGVVWRCVQEGKRPTDPPNKQMIKGPNHRTGMDGASSFAYGPHHPPLSMALTTLLCLWPSPPTFASSKKSLCTQNTALRKAPVEVCDRGVSGESTVSTYVSMFFHWPMCQAAWAAIMLISRLSGAEGRQRRRVAVMRQIGRLNNLGTSNNGAQPSQSPNLL